MASSCSTNNGAARAITFFAAVLGLVWFCKFHCIKLSNKNSETAKWNKGGPSSSGVAQPLFGPVGARQFRMEELEKVTKHFNESNLIGYGSFGFVYKGLLHDGTVVVKRRAGAPGQEFAAEVI